MGDSVSGAAGKEPGDRSQAVRGGVRWMTVGQAGLQVVRLGVQVVLARLLVPDVFGLVAMAMVVVSFLDMVLDLGTGSAVVQRKTVTQVLLNSVFLLNLTIGAALAAALALGAPLIAAGYGDPQLEPIVRVCAVATLCTAAGMIHQAMLRRGMRFARLAGVTLAGAVANGVVAIGMAVAGMGVWALVGGIITGAFVTTGGAWLASPWRPSRVVSFAALQEVWKYSAPLAATNVWNFATVNADKVIIGAVLGPGPLGLYALAQRLLMYPIRTVSQTLQEVLFPAFAKAQDDLPAFRRGYLRACAGIAMVTFPAMCGLAVVAAPAVEVVLGAQWRGAIPLIWVMAPVGAVQSLTYTVAVIYRATGRTDKLLWWSLGSGVVLLTGPAAGAMFGLRGVVIAYAIVNVGLAYPAFVIPFRLINLRMTALLGVLFPYALATAVMMPGVALVQWQLTSAGVSQAGVLVGAVVSGAVVYTTMMWRWRPAAVGEFVALIRRADSARRPGTESAV